MNVLVLNCGSSSVKAAVIATSTGERLLEMLVERVQESQPELSFNDGKPILCPESGHDAVLHFAFPQLQQHLKQHRIDSIGHRVAHGGEYFDECVEIDDSVLEKIEELSDLAPLHNPVNLKGIQIAKEFWPDLPHTAVFDTAFHHTLPRRAQVYALPKAIREKYNIRRYGFHGTSHQFVAQCAADYLHQPIEQLRIITCHLGSGCSVAAVEYGRSVATSMGMTPLEGLVMSTRAGDIDPGIITYLARKEGWDMHRVDELLNKESGLLGLSGVGSDMRDIIDKAAEGHEDCRMALQVFTHRIRKYIGAYAAAMGGVDAVVFTGGIGENSAVVRYRATQRLEFLGAIYSEDRNHELKLSTDEPAASFAMRHSRVELLAIKTDEQLAIAQQTERRLTRATVNSEPSIPIAVSARHMHITQETLEQLFGEGHELTVKAPLSQPGQFAANEQVTVVGPKNRLERVRILGPVRPKNQIEISRTDEFFLGIDAPVRESGKVENTPGIKVIGPKGEVNLKDGLICAWRHIHMTPEDAELFGVEDRDVVDVEVGTPNRPLTFGNVLIRISPKYKLEMHIDTDEANAAELPARSEGALISTERSAQLRKRKL